MEFIFRHKCEYSRFIDESVKEQFESVRGGVVILIPWLEFVEMWKNVTGCIQMTWKLWRKLSDIYESHSCAYDCWWEQAVFRPHVRYVRFVGSKMVALKCDRDDWKFSSFGFYTRRQETWSASRYYKYFKAKISTTSSLASYLFDFGQMNDSITDVRTSLISLITFELDNKSVAAKK